MNGVGSHRASRFHATVMNKVQGPENTVWLGPGLLFIQRCEQRGAELFYCQVCGATIPGP